MTKEQKAEEYVKSVIDVNAFDWKIVREICLAHIAGATEATKEFQEEKFFFNNLVKEKEQRGLEIQEDLLKEKEKLIEQIKKFEKYAWNNLIKEPEKLPEYEKVVEIWIKGMDFPNSACRESIGGGEWRWWVYWGSGYEIGNKSAVIAWREIEKPQF